MKTIQEKIEIYHMIDPYVSKYKIQWLLLLVLKIGQGIPILLSPLILKIFIDRVIDDKNFSYMWIIVAMYIGLYLAETLLKVWHRVVDNALFNNIARELRKSIFQKYMEIPYSKFQEFQISDLVRRLNVDIDMVKIFLIMQVFDYLVYIISLICSIVFMFILNWHLVVAACILAPLSLVLSWKFEGKIEKNARENRKLISDLEENVAKISSSWKEIKANQFEEIQEKNFDRLLQKIFLCKAEDRDLKLKRSIVLDFKEKIVDLLGMYVAGGIFSIAYGVAASTVIAGIGYYDNILWCIRQMIESDAALRGMKPAINRVIEMLGLSEEEPGNVKEIENSHPVYELKNVNFSYTESAADVICQWNIRINKGEKVLLDGISGSGKSTIMKLLAGEIRANEGEVLFYGTDMKSLPMRVCYNYIRKIDPDIYFMDISVREYLQMAKQNATLEEMEQVCRKVHLWEEFQKKSPDLEFRIGENGCKLSKGQRQKLALARLLLNQDKIIMLDEAFSAIDIADKISLCETVLKHFPNETVICAAHDNEIKKQFSKIDLIS